MDLGGIAKGYAVDRAIARLRGAGAQSGYVDLGESSIGLFGRRQTFAIRHPWEPDAAAATFTLECGSISTSAGYERGFERNGKWYSHIIDPRNGLPVTRSLSATVIGKEGEAMKVDALSTAGFVVGPQRAIELWRRFGVEGILVFVGERGGLELVATPGFPR